MTLADLIDAFRARAQDTVEPYLWSDDEVREFATDAENEAAERGRLIRDSTTPEICVVEVLEDQAGYDLDSRIISVERAKMDGATLPLKLTSTDAMDRNGAWEHRTGTPSYAVLDAEGPAWRLTLSPIPTADGTLRLQVFRYPIGPLSSDGGNVPEIHARLHPRLIDWMLHRAYGKQDAETYDRVKAEQAEAVFTASFGPRIDANVRRKQADRATSVVQFQEY
jgi:hypothetical protein